jgi:hypothetical protein
MDSMEDIEVEDELKKTTSNVEVDWSQVFSGWDCGNDIDPGLCLNTVMAEYYWLAGIDVYAMAQDPPFHNPLPDLVPEDVLSPWFHGVLMSSQVKDNVIFLDTIDVDSQYIWNYEYNYIEALRNTNYKVWLSIIDRENVVEDEMLEDIFDEMYPSGID